MILSQNVKRGNNHDNVKREDDDVDSACVHEPRNDLFPSKNEQGQCTDNDDDQGFSFVVPFPWKLHQLLDNSEKEGLDSIVSWMPPSSSNRNTSNDDRTQAFKVHNPDLFVSQIMPRYFKQTKFRSFQRQLNIWGFHRLHHPGVTKGAYTHQFFVRGMPSLCNHMQRQCSAKRSKKRDQLVGEVLSNRVVHPKIYQNISSWHPLAEDFASDDQRRIQTHQEDRSTQVFNKLRILSDDISSQPVLSFRDREDIPTSQLSPFFSIASHKNLAPSLSSVGSGTSTTLGAGFDGTAGRVVEDGQNESSSARATKTAQIGPGQEDKRITNRIATNLVHCMTDKKPPARNVKQGERQSPPPGGLWPCATASPPGDGHDESYISDNTCTLSLFSREQEEEISLWDIGESLDINENMLSDLMAAEEEREEFNGFPLDCSSGVDGGVDASSSFIMAFPC